MSSVTAWRTVLVDQSVDLAYCEGQMVATHKDGTQVRVPLFDVRVVIVASLQVNVTTYLVNELHKRQISLVFCDEKKLPYAELVGYYDHHATPARMREQIRWKKAARQQVWRDVVRQKINNQYALLVSLEVPLDSEKWKNYTENIRVWDKTNREGQAARLYFNALFGKQFHRRRDLPINAALNYGYAILCSAMTRGLTSHGYHPSIGIAHRGATNTLNFSYDLMEPFRPFVDKIVCQKKERELDKEFKRELIGVTGTNVRYRNKTMSLATAIDGYIVDVTGVLTNAKGTIGEINHA